MIWPLCRLYSIANNVSNEKEDGPVGGVGAGKGVGAKALPLGLPGPSKSHCWIIKIPTVLLHICHINGRAETLQGPGIRCDSFNFTQSYD